MERRNLVSWRILWNLDLFEGTEERPGTGKKKNTCVTDDFRNINILEKKGAIFCLRVKNPAYSQEWSRIPSQLSLSQA